MNDLPAAPDAPDGALLSVRGVDVGYRTGRRSRVTAVHDVSFDLYPGQSMALVGESGCGKTTLGLALLRLLPRTGVVSGGEILFRRKDGTRVDVRTLEKERLRRFRWNEAAMVFQGAMNAFNPVLRIEDHFLDTFRAHERVGGRRPRGEILERSARLLETVRLDPARVLGSFPHELSGGMRQRSLIALALALEPQLLILDEPTTALDILTQRSIVERLTELREELGFAMVFITHDLGLAAELADRVGTMYAGRLIETGTTRDIFHRPRHPYTSALINSVPPVAGDLHVPESLPGGPPGLNALPPGCSFAPRCAHAADACTVTRPELEVLEPRDAGLSHAAACLRSTDTELHAEGVFRD
ncbi:dipeptide/oligopeptide/nickel ABC transporter ATP-binding protein [Nocardiopsis terrae]|uniref:Peptide/nickel transport system ATP-binding protein n=1 Tax=Nocardiopsis terrae TaxID=372655 RepID=A0ABR9HKR4_9ACTN|nr:ABC transporter ATP-binding protein [Nocardiopsis terrae]MBE1459605.1 peptide/nickel transport system ATP-binding protein [Nocardiopsis terrae]GHC94915.1 dipeptide/oligopeptide/nickel ABC transporter ATP-binding protein [Nocardiopsis terrae]